MTLPAPLEELPLLAHAGTVLPMLPPDVDTLSDYPDDSTTSLSDSADRLALLALPRGKSSASMFEDELIRSRERGRGWALRIKGERRRTYRLQASLKTLSNPFEPCRVSVGGEPLGRSKWDYDSKRRVVTAKFKGRNVRVVVRRRCG